LQKDKKGKMPEVGSNLLLHAMPARNAMVELPMQLLTAAQYMGIEFTREGAERF
jgi:hypothetical protein